MNRKPAVRDVREHYRSIIAAARCMDELRQGYANGEAPTGPLTNEERRALLEAVASIRGDCDMLEHCLRLEL